MREYATAPMVHYARRFCGGPCVVCGVAMTRSTAAEVLRGNPGWNQVGHSTYWRMDSLYITHSVGGKERGHIETSERTFHKILIHWSIACEVQDKIEYAR